MVALWYVSISLKASGTTRIIPLRLEWILKEKVAS